MAAEKKSPKLTAARRDRLADKSFAEPGKRAYPIDTPGRARDALARVAQNGTPAEQAQVRKAVAKKYPSINVTGVKKTGKGK